MANYVISDIHGEYEMFMRLLEKINLKESDDLYILGDVLDRGPHPIKTLLKLMEMPNVIPIVGNHEIMALDGLKFLNTEITEKSIESVDAQTLGNLMSWQRNGSESTISEFKALDPEMREEVLDYILSFSMYEEVTAGDKNYLLVHAGLGNYNPGKKIEEYSLKEIIWDSADYNVKYFDDVYVVTGHTPTLNIPGNDRPGYIYRKNNHIAIDCGAFIPGGRLAAYCLDTEKEFYVEQNWKTT